LDATDHARITDFGLTTITQNLDSIWSASDDQGHIGRWTAPEILTEAARHSKEADIFSFAMVMVEARYEWAIRTKFWLTFSSPQVYTGAVPFSGSPSPMAMLAIMRGERPSRPAHSVLTDQLWTLMQRCWDQDPYLRPEAVEVSQVLLASSVSLILAVIHSLA
jgi:hypothetical protein